MIILGNSISCYQYFEEVFKDKWDKKKHPKKCLSQFHSIRREESESIEDFSNIFMEVYNSIPTQFKLPPSATKLQYAEAFDSKLTL